MPNLFGIDIAGIVNTKIADAGGALDVVLIKITQGNRGANPTAGRTLIETPYPCKGLVNKSNSTRLTKSLVKDNFKSVLILGGSLPPGIFPEQNDRITIAVEGINNVAISAVPERDPAAATYICSIS